MFHRPRSGLQVRPTLTSDTPEPVVVQAVSRADTTPAPEAPEPVAQMTPEPVSPAPVSTPTTNSQPQQNEEKEAEPMTTNTYQNNQNFQGDAAPAEATATSQQPAPFVQARPAGMQPATMGRSPYAYGSPYGAQDASVNTGRKLVLGEGITMSGEIEACDHLVVEGTVEASLKGASVLDVSQSGMFFGAVEINEATIAGRFEGDLVVNGRLTVRSTGTITGTISYKELAVEAGATIDGKILPLREGRAVTTDKKTQNQKQTKAQSEPSGELFVKAQQSAA